jgi:hypothetical protein
LSYGAAPKSPPKDFPTGPDTGGIINQPQPLGGGVGDTKQLPKFDFKALGGQLLPALISGNKPKIGEIIKSFVLSYLGSLLQNALSDISKVPTNDTNAQQQVQKGIEEAKKSSSDQFFIQLSKILDETGAYFLMRFANITGNDLIRKTNDFLIKDRKSYNDVLTSLGFTKGLSSFVAKSNDCLPSVLVKFIEDQLKDNKNKFDQSLQKAVQGFKFLPIRNLGSLTDKLLQGIKGKQCDEKQLAPGFTPPFIGSAPTRKSSRLSFNQFFNRFKPFATARKALLAQTEQTTDTGLTQEFQQTIGEFASADAIKTLNYMIVYIPSLFANYVLSPDIAEEIKAKQEQAKSDADTGYASQQGSGTGVASPTEQITNYEECVKNFDYTDEAIDLCQEIYSSIVTPAPIIQEIAKTGVKSENEAAKQNKDAKNLLVSLLSNYLEMTIFKILDRSLADITNSIGGSTSKASKSVASKYTSEEIEKACSGMSSLGDDQLAVMACKNTLEYQQAMMAALTQTETGMVIEQITNLLNRLTEISQKLKAAQQTLNDQLAPKIEDFNQQLADKEAAGFDVTELKDQLQELINEGLVSAKTKLDELLSQKQSIENTLNNLAPSDELKTLLDQLEALNNSSTSQEIAALTEELAKLTSGRAGQSDPFANAMSNISDILTNTKLQTLFIQTTKCGNCETPQPPLPSGNTIIIPGTEVALNTGPVDFLNGRQDAFFNRRYKHDENFRDDIFNLAQSILSPGKYKLNQNSVVTAIINNIRKAITGEVSSDWITPTKNYFIKAKGVYQKLKEIGSTNGWLGKTIDFSNEFSNTGELIENNSLLEHLIQLSDGMAKMLEVAESIKNGGAETGASAQIIEIQRRLEQLNQQYNQQKNGLLDQIAAVLSRSDLDELRDVLYGLEKDIENFSLEIDNFTSMLDELNQKTSEFENAINTLAKIKQTQEYAAVSSKKFLLKRLVKAITVPIKALGAATANVLRLLNPIQYLK